MSSSAGLTALAGDRGVHSRYDYFPAVSGPASFPLITPEVCDQVIEIVNRRDSRDLVVLFCEHGPGILDIVDSRGVPILLIALENSLIGNGDSPFTHPHYDLLEKMLLLGANSSVCMPGEKGGLSALALCLSAQSPDGNWLRFLNLLLKHKADILQELKEGGAFDIIVKRMRVAIEHCEWSYLEKYLVGFRDSFLVGIKDRLFLDRDYLSVLNEMKANRLSPCNADRRNFQATIDSISHNVSDTLDQIYQFQASKIPLAESDFKLFKQQLVGYVDCIEGSYVLFLKGKLPSFIERYQSHLGSLVK